MTSSIKNSTLLFAILGWLSSGLLMAQTFTNLHSFTANPPPNYRNSDGAFPIAPLCLRNNTLYGTALKGGVAGFGTMFRVNIDGTGFTNLKALAIDEPWAGLALFNNILYGTSRLGTTLGFVFAVNPDGTGFTNLHAFTGGYDGKFPVCDLVLSGKTLYGTTTDGGSSGYGTVFAINTDSSGFRSVYSFDGSSGKRPYAGLVLSSNTLYGTTQYGGLGYGTIFAVSTNGTDFTTLHNFEGSPDDGANPQADLILLGTTLFGTAANGGILSAGTLFRINTDGTGFTNFHFFSGVATNSSGIYTNSEGGAPIGGLTLSGNKLYGTTGGAGYWGNGTVFAVNTDGTGFTTLYTFSATTTDSSGDLTNSDGATPFAGVILSGNTLYGTTRYGGTSGTGTLFRIDLPVAPTLAITALSGTTIVLSWPTNYDGLSLQFTTNLGPSIVWTTNSPPPVVVNGQYTVTNSISGTQQFYRLSQ